MQKQSIKYYLVPDRESENHALQTGDLEGYEASNIIDQARHATRHHRGGQESCRATNQQSIHHVRPWHSRLSVEENPKRSTLWRIGRITQTQKSQRLCEFREDAELRSDRGALARGRAISNAHTRTRTHSVRHGKNLKDHQVKRGIT